MAINSQSIDNDITTYTYDARQKLIHADILASGELRASDYRYNVDGIRIQKTDAGEVTNYLVDSNRDYAQVIAETDTSNIVAVEYIFGDDLLAQKRGSTVSNYQYDGLGSTRALTDSTGNVSDEYFYDAFGVELARTGTTENDYLFTGEQYDTGLGNYYLRARYYDQGIGRFTQQDTWMGVNSDPVTLHKYLYANADPVQYVDYSGKFGMSELSVTMNIVGILTEMQIDAGLSVFDNLGVSDSDVDMARTASKVLGLAMLGAGGVKIVKMLSRKFKSCNSFTGSTLVATSLGLTPISSLEIGDVVLAFDEETQQVVERPIVHTVQGEGEYKVFTVELVTGDRIDATNGHPFYVSDDGKNWYWAEVNLLKAGQLLKRDNGLPLEIKSIKENEWLGVVYNLTIDKNHSYFVGENRVLAHNANPNKPCRMPEIIGTPTSSLIGARNQARDLAQLGEDAVPYLASRPSRTAGKVYSGMQSADGKRGWRLDFDDNKGMHINWWRVEDGIEWKGAITVKGKSQNDYDELLSHFPLVGI